MHITEFVSYLTPHLSIKTSEISAKTHTHHFYILILPYKFQNKYWKPNQIGIETKLSLLVLAALPVLQS